MNEPNCGVLVAAVRPNSLAYRAGLQAGAVLHTVNGQQLRDTVDYMYVAGGEEQLEIEWTDSDGRRRYTELQLDALNSDIGVELSPDPVQTCVNRCRFCFVDQMPQGMRRTLYVKDDDWRSSFLYGTYVTLTNLRECDVKRIIEQRISPIYVSVHASDDGVRARLLGTEAARQSFSLLQRLVQAGIQVHAQCVVCEGVNDGTVLEDTICALYALRPNLLSLSVVPVGLTKFRRELPDVRTVSQDNAARIVDFIEMRQCGYLRDSGTRFVFAADELYLRSGRSIPPFDAYEDFAQIENGVGLVASFEHGVRTELERVSACGRPGHRSRQKILFLTGTSFAPRLASLLRHIEHQLPVAGEVRAVENQFFGPTITVAGLLTGSDLRRVMTEPLPYDAVFVPAVMFRDAADRTLDNVSYHDIASRAGIPCLKASSDGSEFVRQIIGLCEGRERRYETWQNR